jgi:hypothetical protein
MATQYVGLKKTNEGIRASNSNAIITLIYNSNTDKNYLAAFDTLVQTDPSKFFYIDADKQSCASNLVPKIPCIFGFKNTVPLGFMTSEVTLPNILNFYNKVSSYETSNLSTKKSDINESIKHKNDNETYRTLYF